LMCWRASSIRAGRVLEQGLLLRWRH